MDNNKPLYLVPLETSEDEGPINSVSGVQYKVYAGAYDPPSDQVAEHVIAWLFSTELAQTA